MSNSIRMYADGHVVLSSQVMNQMRLEEGDKIEFLSTALDYWFVIKHADGARITCNNGQYRITCRPMVNHLRWLYGKDVLLFSIKPSPIRFSESEAFSMEFEGYAGASPGSTSGNIHDTARPCHSASAMTPVAALNQN